MSTTTNLNDLAVDSISISGVAVDTAVLLASGQAVDLNGEAGGLILDAAAVVVLQGATAGHGKLVVSGSTVVDVSAAATALTGTLSVSGAATLSAAATVGTTLGVTGITTATGGLVTPGQAITGDGAITITPNASVKLSKGSAAAITIAAPTSTTHDYYTIRVFSTTAFAHVVTCSTDGFNAKGSSGTVTLGGAIGDGFSLIAFGGHWYVTSTKNATVA